MDCESYKEIKSRQKNKKRNFEKKQIEKIIKEHLGSKGKNDEEKSERNRKVDEMRRNVKDDATVETVDKMF